VRGINEKIQNHLAEFTYMAGNEFEVTRQNGFDLGHILPFVTGYRERGQNRFVNVPKLLFIGTGMREFFHGLHNL